MPLSVITQPILAVIQCTRMIRKISAVPVIINHNFSIYEPTIPIMFVLKVQKILSN